MGKSFVLCVLIASLIGCGSSVESSTTTGSGGATGSSSGGSTGGVTISTATTTSTTTVEPVCSDPDPLGCSYPEPNKGYYPGADAGGAVFPLPGEEEGATASCMDPLDDKPYGHVAVAFEVDAPAQMAIEVWTQPTQDPTGHIVQPALLDLVSTENGPSTLVTGVYALPAPVQAPGLVPCIGIRVADLHPSTLLPSDACYQPTRTWYYGLPATGNPADPLTWSMLECPVDPDILGYRREYPYELRQ